ncbi:MAG: tetratricopeptide repeat protein [Phycisphaerales bacterium]|jgi:TolA-binding protein
MRALLAIAMVVLCSHAAPGQDGDRSLRTANGLLQRGLHAEAATEYAQALRSLDDATSRDQARYGLAVARYNLGEDEAAIRVLSELETGSRFAFKADADVLRTHLYFRQKDYARAATAARDAIAHRDHAGWAGSASLLIESLHRAGQHAEATRAYPEVADRLQAGTDAARRAAYFAGLSQSAIARRDQDHARAAEWFARAVPRRGRDDLSDLALLQRAASLRSSGDVNGAITTYERAIATGDRTKPDAMLQLASIYRVEGRSGEAANLLRSLAEEAPRHQPARVQYELGLALLDIDEPNDAARALDRAARHDAGELADGIAYWRSKADLRRGRDEDAAERLGEAIDRFPRSPLLAEMRYDRAVALQRAGDDETAFAQFGQFVEAHPDHPMAPEALFAQASLALDADQLDTAAKLAGAFEAQHADHPLASRVEFMRSETAYRASDFEAAAEGFRGLLDVEDERLATQARYRLGMSLHAIGRSVDAGPHLAAVTDGSRTPAEFVPALFALGEIAFDDDRWPDAQQRFADYRSAAGTEDDSADDAAMKIALAQIRLGNTADAVRTLDSLLSTWPRSEHGAHAMFELGQARVSMGEDRAAERMFAQLLERYGETRFVPYALRHLAAIASRQGDAERAASLYAQAAELGGEALADEVAIDRARALINAGRPDEAARLLRRAEGPARAWRIVALSRAGQHSAAVEAAEDYTPRGLEPSDAAVFHFALATSLRLSGDAARAMPLLEQLARGRSAVAPNAALDLADLQIAQKQFAPAAQILEPLLERDGLAPGVASIAAYKAAWARYQLGDHRAVVRLLDDRDMADLTGPASLLLGESLLALKRGREAAEQFAAALAKPSAEVDAEAALLRLGEAHAAAQDWRNSQAAYERHRREHARSPRWYMAEFGIGWALENSGRPRQAIDHYRAVADKHKGDTAARAQFQLGECLFALGEHEDAVRELLRVDILHASPTWSAAALYEAGRCFEAMGKVGEARAQYRAVQERFTESTWAAAAGERLSAIAGPGGGRVNGRGG